MIKNKFTHSIKTNQLIFYCLSFLIPALSFFIYFACNHFNILTVDLGQQYVDFFAFFRRNLFTHPLSLIYSFQNGLGSSMLATDAYYLLSPFNLLFFFFSEANIPFVILLIISLKIGTAGLTSFYYWQNKGSKFYALAASLAYALSGYVIANHFNLMWLDSVLLLPLLIRAIDRYLKKEPNHLILITFALWVTNFYTGLMVLFFGFLYFIVQLLPNTKEKWRLFLNYIWHSALASFSAAFVLLPVFFEMLTSKSQDDSQWALSFQFNPLQELTKLALGSYDFQEMQTGLPNIYFSLTLLFFVLLYFFNQKIALKKKVANGILLLFMLFSLVFTPLVLFWHLGQFPIWYPARFSFTLIFLCLNLAVISLNSDVKVPLWQKIVLVVLTITLICYWYFDQNKVDFLNETNLLISSLFLVLSLLYISFIHRSIRLDGYFLNFIITLELIINLVLSLNNLSYQRNSDYQNFMQNALQASSYLNQKDHHLFRTEKTFYRSDDDSMTGNYNGISSFNSTTNHQTLDYLSNLGYLHNSNSVTNNGGTPLSDALLGIKYYLVPNTDNSVASKKQMKYDNNNSRLDIFTDQIHNFKQLSVIKNNNVLPLLYLSKRPIKITNKIDEPMQNQQALLRQSLGTNQIFIKNISWPNPILQGCHVFQSNWRQYTQKKNARRSSVSFILHTQPHRSYYLEIPANIDENSATLLVNNHPVDLTVRDNQNHLLNLAVNTRNHGKIRITFIFKQKQIDLNSANLWAINMPKLTRALASFRKRQPQIYQPNSLTVQTSSFKTRKRQIMASSIPYSYNWLVFDKNHLLHKEKYNQTFVSFNLAKGSHQIKLIYIPWALLIGILLSLLSLCIIKK